MEKDFRLFVKNLPININETRVKELFEKYITIKKIDLKEKKDLDDKINKFAFINVTTTEKQLNKCFSSINHERIDGFQISVELAKESFLERLKRERTENEAKKDKHIIKANEDYERPISIINNVKSTSKPKRKTFSDDFDFAVDDVQVKESKKVEKQEVIPEDEIDLQESSCHQKYEKKDSRNSNEFVKVKKNILDENYLNGFKSNEIFNKKQKNKRDNDLVNEIVEKPINESEKKRLMSLKQKRQTFKTQEQTIRNALRFIDDKITNNKIVFDDNIDLQSPEKKAEKKKNNKSALFDSDDEDQEEVQWNEEELEAKANLKQKLLKLQTNIGNDKRFVLDERFIDNEEKPESNEIEEKPESNEIEEKSNDSDEIDEKKWQLDILGNMLGKSITTSNTVNNDSIRKKNRMIRYDPTASNHQDYEVIVEKSKPEKPAKKKRKISISEEKEEPPIPTSTEVFYEVSDKLVDSLKQSEGFSLLKTFGRDIPNDDTNENKVNTEIRENGENFKFNFSGKSPFKYDSSDDEADEEDGNQKTTLNSNTEVAILHQKSDRLFFALNDSRFQEAENFFKNQPGLEEDAFKHRRRELKEIVRSKIRNNLRKTSTWNKKKVRKIRKKVNKK